MANTNHEALHGTASTTQSFTALACIEESKAGALCEERSERRLKLASGRPKKK